MMRLRPLLSRRHALIAAGAAALPLPVFAQAVGAADRTIVPGERVGAIRKGSTWNSLVNVYKPANIRRAQIHTGEGEMEAGARLFAGKPDLVEIVFMHDKRTVGSAKVTTQGGAWKTPQGIRVGTTLEELEKLNGGPFPFSGFGWDGAGGAGGENLPKGLAIVLAPTKSEGLTAEERDQITGDITVKSDNPVARKVAPVVASLEVTFH